MLSKDILSQYTQVPKAFIIGLKPSYKNRLIHWLVNNHWITHKFCISCKKIYSVNCFNPDANEADRRVPLCKECAASGVSL